MQRPNPKMHMAQGARRDSLPFLIHVGWSYTGIEATNHRGHQCAIFVCLGFGVYVGGSCCFLFVLFSQSSPWQVWISRLLSFFGPGWARSTVPCASSNERKNQGMMTRQPSAGVGQKALGEMSRVIQSWVSNTSISGISFKISYRILKLKGINFKKLWGQTEAGLNCGLSTLENPCGFRLGLSFFMCKMRCSLVIIIATW